MLIFPSRRSPSLAVVRPDPALLTIRILPSEPAVQRLLQTTQVPQQPHLPYPHPIADSSGPALCCRRRGTSRCSRPYPNRGIVVVGVELGRAGSSRHWLQRYSSRDAVGATAAALRTVGAVDPHQARRRWACRRTGLHDNDNSCISKKAGVAGPMRCPHA